jgi:hypothetical protein
VANECKHCGMPEVVCGFTHNRIYYQPTCDCILSKDPEDPNNISANIYKNNCWSCDAKIDSRVCLRDGKPHFGYICKKCGKSLREYYNRC